MIFNLSKYSARVMIAFLVITPFLILLAPRAMSWWPAVLGLVALACQDKTKDPLWIAACIPLWAATLAIISTLWAAFPHDTFMHAIDRLPMYYGFSLGILGLSRLQHDIWKCALPFMSWTVLAGTIITAIDQVAGHPIAHLYNTLNGEPDHFVRAAVNNRVLTGITMMMVPVAWTLQGMNRKWAAGAFLAVLLSTLCISEASAAMLASFMALLVAAAASWKPALVQKVMRDVGVMVIMLIPLIASYVFTHRPDWSYLNSPSNGGRLEIWHFLSQLVYARPMAGYGYEATRYFDMPPGMIFFKEPAVLHPHNAALQVWVEFGLVGMILALEAWIVLMKQVRLAPTLAYMTLVCVIGLLSFGLWQGTWLGLILFTAFYWKAAATEFGTRIK